MIEEFKIIVTYLGGLTTICGGLACLIKIVKTMVLMSENVKQIPELTNDIKEMKKELRDNSLDTYRLVIINHNMPLDERIECGKRYIASGGNGGIKKIVNELEQQKADEDYEILNPHKYCEH